MFESMAEIFKQIDQNQPELVKYHLRALPEALRQKYLKDGIKDNPFGLYISYLDLHKPISYKLRNAQHEQEIEGLETLIESMKQEVNSQQNLT